jgi:hypothetical protein
LRRDRDIAAQAYSVPQPIQTGATAAITGVAGPR